MKNKKAAEMTIGTIIIIILALVVLVFLIYGFTVGWGNLWNNILNLGGGTSNVQTIVSSCQIACSTSSQFDYCKDREVKFGKDMGDQIVAGVKLNPSGTGKMSCKTLSNYGPAGLSCDTISCNTVNGENGLTNGDENPPV
jgi:hypothetical protein